MFLRHGLMTTRSACIEQFILDERAP